MWSLIVKLSLQLLIIVVALVPLWIFIALWFVLAPNSFFESFAMLVLGWFFFGTFQGICLVGGFMLSLSLWEE